LWVAFLDPSDSYFLFADLVGFYTHWTYMHIFRHIFLSNYWWQKSDIWSQTSYRYSISWEAFLDPSDSYFIIFIFTLITIFNHFLVRTTFLYVLQLCHFNHFVFHDFYCIFLRYTCNIVQLNSFYIKFESKCFLSI
jgi:hypothetical protein